MSVGKDNPEQSQAAFQAWHEQTLNDEEIGVRHRIHNYYLPLFLEYARAKGRNAGSLRVLDCGCGNGTSLEVLSGAGFDAYGIDVGGFRQEHWSERSKMPKVHLFAGDATAMPFADGSFDIIFSCGMLEHIGVREGCTPEYFVEPVEGQAMLREAFLRESMRVLRPGGVIFVDHPNGDFPIDFWHVDLRHVVRLRRLSEGFLPTMREVTSLAKRVAPDCTVEAISPAGRFTFRRSRRHWFGKMFAGTLEGYFELLRYPPFSLLAGTALNPYLVIRISRQRKSNA